MSDSAGATDRPFRRRSPGDRPHAVGSSWRLRDTLRDLAPLAAAFAVLIAAFQLPTETTPRAVPLTATSAACANDQDPALAFAARGAARRLDIDLVGTVTARPAWYLAPGDASASTGYRPASLLLSPACPPGASRAAVVTLARPRCAIPAPPC